MNYVSYSTRLICSLFLIPVKNLAAEFWTSCMQEKERGLTHTQIQCISVIQAGWNISRLMHNDDFLLFISCNQCAGCAWMEHLTDWFTDWFAHRCFFEKLWETAVWLQRLCCIDVLHNLHQLIQLEQHSFQAFCR